MKTAPSLSVAVFGQPTRQERAEAKERSGFQAALLDLTRRYGRQSGATTPAEVLSSLRRAYEVVISQHPTSGRAVALAYGPVRDSFDVVRGLVPARGATLTDALVNAMMLEVDAVWGQA